MRIGILAVDAERGRRAQPQRGSQEKDEEKSETVELGERCESDIREDVTSLTLQPDDQLGDGR